MENPFHDKANPYREGTARASLWSYGSQTGYHLDRQLTSLGLLKKQMSELEREIAEERNNVASALAALAALDNLWG